MKTFRYFGFGLLAALFVGCTAVTLFAAGGQAEERAGYQGIPVRNGLNRGIIQRDDSSNLQRYPRLPRRQSETALAETSALEGYQVPGDRERGGYSGIPQPGPYPTATRNDLSSEAQLVDRGGYGGIPRGIARDRRQAQANNTLAVKRASSLVRPK